MSFHSSAQDIRVDDGHILRGRLANANGDWVDSEVDLDQYLGNYDGRFQWGGQGFSGSAQNISFSLEGADNVPILRANLINGSGEAVGADVNLSERFGNNDGQFYYNQ